MGRIIYIKKDLALNNLEKLVCHKTQTTNQQKVYTFDENSVVELDFEKLLYTPLEFFTSVLIYGLSQEIE